MREGYDEPLPTPDGGDVWVAPPDGEDEPGQGRARPVGRRAVSRIVTNAAGERIRVPLRSLNLPEPSRRPEAE